MVQCPRDTRCLKEKGHKGFCQFKGVVSGDSDGKRVTRHTGAGGSTRVDRMKELAAKREQQHAGRGGRGSSMQDDDDEGDGDWDDEDVEYQDFGMTQAERRAARGSHGAAYEQGSMQDEDAAYGGEDWSGPAAPPECIESIRLARQRLELWQLEPFFDETVVGCIVRIGLGQTEMGGSGLYRAAEVVAVKEMPEQPYTLGTRRSTKRLQLEFGECRRSYPMTSVDAKVHALQQAANYQYSEQEVSRKVQQERASAVAPVLTTRQKLAMQHSAQVGARTDANQVSRPVKFQRNVLGQAVFE